MKLSRNGAMSLMAEEAISLQAYKDGGGVWTIGCGHTAFAGPPKPKAGMRLTLAQCLGLLADDLKDFERNVEEAIRVPLKQHEFDALVLFHYNTGAISSGSVDDKLNLGDVKAALATINLYVKDDGKTIEGLVARRARELEMFRHGDYFPRAILLYDAYPKGKTAVDPIDIQWPGDAGPVPPPSVAPSVAPQPAPPDVEPKADDCRAPPRGPSSLVWFIIAALAVAIGGWFGVDLSGVLK